MTLTTDITDTSGTAPQHPGFDVRAADALAPMVEIWFRILTDHVPDENRRCSACTTAGTGARRTPWPCSLRAVAESARERHAAEAPGSPHRAPGRRRLQGERGASCPLTPREQEFLQLAADGCSDAEIAERLGLPERTVGTSIRRIMRGVGVPRRDSLLVLALRTWTIA